MISQEEKINRAPDSSRIKEINPIEDIMMVIADYPAHEQNKIWFEVREILLRQRYELLERLSEEKDSIESQIQSMEEATKELKQA